jgi:hypothetical protein
MRKVVFGIIATVILGFVGNAQTVTECAVLKTGNRVYPQKSTSDASARTFTIINFDQNYKVIDTYVIDGVEYTDTGKYNDLKAGDGIYTSVKLFPNPKSQVSAYLISDDFKYTTQLNNVASKIKIGCKVRHVRTGTTILGDSCAKNCCGCLELYDCEISWEF